jgi:hypothetical protein
VEVSVKAELLTLDIDGALTLVLGDGPPHRLHQGRYQARRVGGSWSEPEVVT